MRGRIAAKRPRRFQGNPDATRISRLYGSEEREITGREETRRRKAATAFRTGWLRTRRERTSSRGGRTATLVYSLRGGSQERRPSGGRRGPQRRGGPADDGRGPGLPASSPLSGAFGDGCYLLLLSLFSLTKSSEPSVSSSSSPDEMASVFKRTHPRLCFLPGHGPSPPPVFLDRAADAQEPAGSVRARV